MNAQVLASTFSQESHLLIKLGEAVGAVLQSCTASKKPFSHVQITTEGKATLYPVVQPERERWSYHSSLWWSACETDDVFYTVAFAINYEDSLSIVNVFFKKFCFEMFDFLLVEGNTIYCFLQTRGLHEVLHWLYDFISTCWTAES